MDHGKLLELKRKRARFVSDGLADKVKAVDAEIAKLRKSGEQEEAEAEASVEAAVEPPVAEKAVRGHPGRRPRG